MILNASEILAIAHGLISEESAPNPQYDRALVEMTCALLGWPIDDNRGVVEELIRGVRGR